jgi:hypothetical protein
MEFKKRKRGRPKGKTKQPLTVMLLVDDIKLAGGVKTTREKIINNFKELIKSE